MAWSTTETSPFPALKGQIGNGQVEAEQVARLCAGE